MKHKNFSIDRSDTTKTYFYKFLLCRNEYEPKTKGGNKGIGTVREQRNTDREREREIERERERKKLSILVVRRVRIEFKARIIYFSLGLASLHWALMSNRIWPEFIIVISNTAQQIKYIYGLIRT